MLERAQALGAEPRAESRATVALLPTGEAAGQVGAGDLSRGRWARHLSRCRTDAGSPSADDHRRAPPRWTPGGPPRRCGCAGVEADRLCRRGRHGARRACGDRDHRSAPRHPDRRENALGRLCTHAGACRGNSGCVGRKRFQGPCRFARPRSSTSSQRICRRTARTRGSTALRWCPHRPASCRPPNPRLGSWIRWPWTALPTNSPTSMEPGRVYLFGPGLTTQRILHALGIRDGTLLGVDAVQDGRLIGRDLGEGRSWPFSTVTPRRSSPASSAARASCSGAATSP